MTVKFSPCLPFGNVAAPPSKSVAHRYLIAAFLSGGKCKIDNISFSEDIQATADCLEALGAKIERGNASITVMPGGTASDILNCRESGSTLRFLIPYALTTGREITFIGSKKLFERPLGVYEKTANENGFLFKKSENSLVVRGNLKNGEYSLPGNISSQFITGLLFALSTLSEDSVIKVIPPFESRSYVNITLSVLKQFGIFAKIDGNNIKIQGGGKYIPQNLVTESDYSNAAYLDLLNFSGGNVTVTGLDKTCQGDAVYKDYFKKLDNFCTLDISDCPDLGPALISAAAMQNGVVLTGTRRLAVKESDRGAAMAQELAKFGIKVNVEENKITVENATVKKPSAPLNSHNDHRIVMALAALLCKTGGEMCGTEAVKKSFPDYFDVLKSLGAKFTIQED